MSVAGLAWSVGMSVAGLAWSVGISVDVVAGLALSSITKCYCVT